VGWDRRLRRNCDSLKVHFSVNAKWQFVYTVRFAPSRSAATVAVSLKLRVYGEYLYLNSPILMPRAWDCLKNVHCMSAIYLLHLLIFLSRCLQLAFQLFTCIFLQLSSDVSSGLPYKLSRCQSVKCCSVSRYTFWRGRGPHINIHLHECSSGIKIRGDFLRLS